MNLKANIALLEYKKYWYEAMEKVFKEDGVLDKDSLRSILELVRNLMEIFKYGKRFEVNWKFPPGLGTSLEEGIWEKVALRLIYWIGRN